MDYNELAPEIKAKLQECKTADDIAALAKSEGYDLSDEELEAISGGTWGCNNRICSEFAPCRQL